jgi:hypothetical protein
MIRKFIILSYFLVIFSTTVYADINSGLVGWWRFEEGTGTTTVDSSGNGNTGTLVSGPTWKTGCKRAGCLNIAGTSYVEVNNSSSLAITGAITISAWVKVTSFATYRGIVGKTSSHIPAPYDYYIHTDGAITFYSGNGGSGGGGASHDGYRSQGSITAGVWRFIAVTYTGGNSGTVIHYIDGLYNSSNALSYSEATANNAAKKLYIGTREDGVTQMLGDIDDIRIYNRVLTAQEVKELYLPGAVLRGAVLNGVKINQ